MCRLFNFWSTCIVRSLVFCCTCVARSTYLIHTYTYVREKSSFMIPLFPLLFYA